MIRCPQCDHFNLQGAATCERCGTALSASEPPAASAISTGVGTLDAQVLTIAATGGKIAAIKWYREQTGCGLKEAKDAVESLLRQHNVSPRQSGCAGAVLLVIAAAAAVVLRLV